MTELKIADFKRIFRPALRELYRTLSYLTANFDDQHSERILQVRTGLAEPHKLWADLCNLDLLTIDDQFQQYADGKTFLWSGVH